MNPQKGGSWGGGVKSCWKGQVLGSFRGLLVSQHQLGHTMDLTQAQTAPRGGGGDFLPPTRTPLARPQPIARRDVVWELRGFVNATASGTSSFHAWGFGWAEAEAEPPLLKPLIQPGTPTAAQVERDEQSQKKPQQKHHGARWGTMTCGAKPRK